jgi:hypothetical protein
MLVAMPSPSKAEIQVQYDDADRQKPSAKRRHVLDHCPLPASEQLNDNSHSRGKFPLVTIFGLAGAKQRGYSHQGSSNLLPEPEISHGT